jgi:hypothetical protein
MNRIKKKFEELKNKKDSKEYQQWFLRYIPMEILKNRKQHNKSIKKLVESSKRKNYTKKIRK